ncbi:hypothetical protein SAMN05444414_1257 [Roseovarius marisflavi]|uniref:SGNH/GDSL hydrolase family protein n=1 Tax=Roseovarius marisflavi TaxID=1054996 RepID=A0A1M7CFM2_9RHOB|nr:hypothetical protein [Roseovarius marisflavi]SHL65946.1 hypothetical protein SAMN05444414_1257 [Roseovarius marisflavi]
MSIVIYGSNSVFRRLLRRLRRHRLNRFDNSTFLKYVAGKSYAFQENSEHIETLALRDSHADYGLFTPEFPGSFNLGLTSGDLYTAFQLYSTHHKKLRNLRRVVLFFGVFSPGFSLINTSERYRTVAYKYYLSVPYQDRSCINKLAEMRIVQKCRKISSEEFSEGQFGYKKKTFFLEDVDVEKRAAVHLKENRRHQNQLIWLERLLQLISLNKHSLYIVIPPARSDYRACLPSKHELFKDLYSIKLENTKIIDCFEGNVVGDEGMGDTDHPNEEGAIKLTKYLRQIIAEIEGSA